MFKDADGHVKDIEAVVVSDNGGITFFGSNRFDKVDISFPYLPPIHPEKVYIEYTDATETSYEIITDQPERIKALHDRKRKEYDEIDI